MSRNVQLVLLCEDRQHEAFARRFLEKAGWPTRRLRVQIAPQSRGSAEQFVRERFPPELSAYRSKRHQVAQGLVVVIDGDERGVHGRLTELADACQDRNVQPRQPGERVAIFVPTRNIETWLAYLDGQTVNENDPYSRLARERDCRQHVKRLYEMCQQGALRLPAPPSLQAACDEYRTRLRPE
ncbi:MAG: hypothetical protein GYA33_11465 [Thermogutta sp.]|nr:hypothetical protein [Thermogutta sp.]